MSRITENRETFCDDAITFLLQSRPLLDNNMTNMLYYLMCRIALQYVKEVEK